MNPNANDTLGDMLAMNNQRRKHERDTRDHERLDEIAVLACWGSCLTPTYGLFQPMIGWWNEFGIGGTE